MCLPKAQQFNILLVKTFGVCKNFCFERNVYFYSRTIKCDRKRNVILLQNISISNECCSFELHIHQCILRKCESFHRNIKQFSTPIIRNVISEGSCVKTGVMMLKIRLCITGINYIFKNIKIKNTHFKL